MLSVSSLGHRRPFGLPCAEVVPAARGGGVRVLGCTPSEAEG